ncbi:MAG: FAD-dependent oxidoreductase [Burkholderiaceae bacterium]
MKRRHLLRAATAVPLFGAGAARFLPDAFASPAAAGMPRVRPGDATWPSQANWTQLANTVGGRLVKVPDPMQPCRDANAAAACAAHFKALKNPYFLGDDVALTQTLGWVDAWTSQPSAYAVLAHSAADVVAAVDFARTHHLRLVVKGGGHSYQGRSNAPDSLLVWTRSMDAITLHDAFIATGCAAKAAPVRAVTVGAGALWAHVYDAVTTRAGGYVQGGGCMTVGVAGLIQSGGFGSFSKAFGLAAASLLEAEVVTADGAVQVANACINPELFWGLKGGGGGSLGVVTRLTLRVHALPESFGAVNMSLQASSDAAFRRLIGLIVDFCARSLLNPHWGEQIRLRPNNRLQISMVFQGLQRSQAVAVWQPFMDALDAAPDDFTLSFSPFRIVSTSARTFWSPTLIKRALGFISRDDRPGAPASNVFWPGDQGQAGQVLYGYQSAWMPAALLQDANRSAFCDALFAASRHWGVSLHLNRSATTPMACSSCTTALAVNAGATTASRRWLEAPARVPAGHAAASPYCPAHNIFVACSST